MKPLFCNIHQYGNFNIYSPCSPFLGAVLSTLGDLKAPQLLGSAQPEKKKKRTATRTPTHTAAQIHSFYLGKVAPFFFSSPTYPDINVPPKN